MRKYLLISLLTCIFFSPPIFSQINELGIPFTRNYKPKEYNAAEQNWAIVQDHRGVMYFGNNEKGILEYDGSTWRQIDIPNNSIVRSLAVDSLGTVYAGALGEFGFLAPDYSGKIKYHSLSSQIDTAKYKFTNSNIWKIYATSSDVYFCTIKHIFKYNRQKPIKVIELPSGSFFSFLVNNKLYFSNYDKGLMQIANDKDFIPVDTVLFKEKDIFTILPYEENKLLIGTMFDGLFIHDLVAKTTTTFDFNNDANKLNQLIKEAQLYHGTLLPNKTFALATLAKGLIIFDKNGKILNIFNKNTGLQDETIMYVYANKNPDKSKTIWLATNYGIINIEYDSPIRRFEEESGLKGFVLDVVKFKNRLYVGTLIGVYYLEYSEGSLPKFVKINNINSQSWSFCVLKKPNGVETLLVGTNSDIYEIVDKKAIPLNQTSFVSYKLASSGKNPNTLYVGTAKGFVIGSYQNGVWKTEEKFQEITEEIRNIYEDFDGNIWLGTLVSGVIKITPERKIIRYGQNKGFPCADQIGIYQIKNHLLFTSPKGIYEYLKEKDTIVPFKAFGEKFSTGNVGAYRFSVDYSNNCWINALNKEKQWIEHAITTKDNEYIIDSIPFKRIPSMSFQTIFNEQNGVTWIGGGEGLLSFDSRYKKNYKTHYNTIIRTISIGEDSVIFNGTYYHLAKKSDTISPKEILISLDQPEELKLKINYANNSIKFTYAAPFFEDENSIQYSYYLEGYQNNWSKWSKKNEAVYTNLFEGKYKFYVKAKNVFDEVSTVASFEFEILPPWYRTIWAYISYAILAVLIVWCIVIIATWRIKRLNIAYGRYLPGSFLKLLGKLRVIDIRLGDMVEKEVTIMFSDIRSYTSLSESMTPHDNFRFLVKYLGLIGDMLHQNTGFPVQYYGDGIMAMFHGDTDNALNAAIDMHNAVAEYSKERALKNRRTLQIGVGLHTGKIVMGIRGDKRRWEGGIVGDSVNLAARMEGLTKMYGASTMFSEDLYIRLKNPKKFHIRFLGKVKVKGKEMPVGIYELIDGLPKEEFEIKIKTLKDFDEAMTHYFNKDITKAKELFAKVLAENANDVAALHYFNMCEQLLKDGIPSDWDGVEKLDKK